MMYLGGQARDAGSIPNCLSSAWILNRLGSVVQEMMYRSAAARHEILLFLCSIPVFHLAFGAPVRPWPSRGVSSMISITRFAFLASREYPPTHVDVQAVVEAHRLLIQQTYTFVTAPSGGWLS